MLFRKVQLIGLTLLIALIALFFVLEFFGTAAPAVASGRDQNAASSEDLVFQAKPTRLPPIIIVTTDVDYSEVEILDLAGERLGEGLHFGKLKCNGDNCSQKTTVILDEAEYVYKFSSRRAFDPAARSVVVQGTGTLIIGGLKERFSFFATFLDNRDGTFWSKYEASRSDASLVVPSTPGRFEIGSQ